MWTYVYIGRNLVSSNLVTYSDISIGHHGDKILLIPNSLSLISQWQIFSMCVYIYVCVNRYHQSKLTQWIPLILSYHSSLLAITHRKSSCYIFTINAVLFILAPISCGLIGLQKSILLIWHPILNFLTLFKSPQTAARFRCMTSLALRHPFCLGVLWHLSDTSIRPYASALTPASMLHPTNPCAEPKGSQPN